MRNNTKKIPSCCNFISKQRPHFNGVSGIKEMDNVNFHFEYFHVVLFLRKCNYQLNIHVLMDTSFDTHIQRHLQKPSFPFNAACFQSLPEIAFLSY